jgi:hypothetical protein
MARHDKAVTACKMPRQEGWYRPPSWSGAPPMADYCPAEDAEFADDERILQCSSSIAEAFRKKSFCKLQLQPDVVALLQVALASYGLICSNSHSNSSGADAESTSATCTHTQWDSFRKVRKAGSPACASIQARLLALCIPAWNGRAERLNYVLASTTGLSVTAN